MSLPFASILLIYSFLVTRCVFVPYWLACSELSIKKVVKCWFIFDTCIFCIPLFPQYLSVCFSFVHDALDHSSSSPIQTTDLRMNERTPSLLTSNGLVFIDDGVTNRLWNNQVHRCDDFSAPLTEWTLGILILSRKVSALTICLSFVVGRDRASRLMIDRRWDLSTNNCDRFSLLVHVD